MNKIGTDKILSIYWFVILTIIAGGVFIMVYNFYGAPYDVREIESGILADKIADCISKQGTIDSDFFVEGNFSSEIGETFMNKCSLNFNVEEGYGDANEIQYFYEVKFYNLTNVENSEYSFNGGNLNWKADCSIREESNKEYNKLAKCTERRFYALNDKGGQYLIKILSIIGKSEKNVKQ